MDGAYRRHIIRECFRCNIPEIAHAEDEVDFPEILIIANDYCSSLRIIMYAFGHFTDSTHAHISSIAPQQECTQSAAKPLSMLCHLVHVDPKRGAPRILVASHTCIAAAGLL